MKKNIQELLGTALLVLLGCGIASTSTIILATSVNLPGAFTVSIVATSFAASYYIANHLFGDKETTFNPVLTLANLLTKKEKIAPSISKIIFQIIGGFVGAEILGIILGQYGHLGANGYGDVSILGCNLAQAAAVETITALILTLSYLKDKTPNKLNTTITIALIYAFAIPYTNGGANPARSIGPALLVQGAHLSQLWLFILFPLLGAILATIIHHLINSSKK